MSDFNSARLYVGNLPKTVVKTDLMEMFVRCGHVRDIYIPYVRDAEDRPTAQAKGFAFVEMGSGQDAQQAITLLHQSYGPDGCRILVRVADQRAPILR